MAARAATRVTGAEAYQKTTHNHEEEAAYGQQALPVEKVCGQEAVDLSDAVFGQIGGQVRVNLQRLRVLEPGDCNDCADQYASNEE